MSLLVSIESKGFNSEQVNGLTNETFLRYAIAFPKSPLVYLKDGRLAVIEEKDEVGGDDYFLYFNHNGELMYQYKYYNPVFRVLPQKILEERSSESELLEADESLIDRYLPLGVYSADEDGDEAYIDEAFFSIPDYTQEEIEEEEKNNYDLHEVYHRLHDSSRGTDIQFKDPVYVFSDF